MKQATRGECSRNCSLQRACSHHSSLHLLFCSPLSFFLSNLTTFIYLPIFGVIVGYTLKYTNLITPEMLAFPKRKYLWMGCFDALSGICMLFGGLHTSGSFQALLVNCVIPFTMVLSVLILRTRYHKTQYAGAAVILAGVAVVLVPAMVNGNNSDNNALFNIIFLLSTVPQAVSSIYKVRRAATGSSDDERNRITLALQFCFLFCSVHIILLLVCLFVFSLAIYKELAFGSIELDVNLMQLGVAIFQFLMSAPKQLSQPQPAKHGRPRCLFLLCSLILLLLCCSSFSSLSVAWP